VQDVREAIQVGARLALVGLLQQYVLLGGRRQVRDGPGERQLVATLGQEQVQCAHQETTREEWEVVEVRQGNTWHIFSGEMKEEHISRYKIDSLEL